MAYDWVGGYLSAKPLAVKEYQKDWQAWRWVLHGKMFALIGEDNEKRPLLSLKCEPMLALDYRERYPDIIPGYYLNKAHWNSILLEGAVPDDTVRELIDTSHELVFASLPKKLRLGG